jgi:hypothetical protein
MSGLRVPDEKGVMEIKTKCGLIIAGGFTGNVDQPTRGMRH